MNIDDYNSEWERLTAKGLTPEEINLRLHQEKAVCDAAKKARESSHPVAQPGTVIPLPVQAHQAVGQAMRDVMTLACDIRDADPAESWALIETWTPTRIVSALVVAAAGINPDTHTEDDLWGWARGLAS